MLSTDPTSTTSRLYPDDHNAKMTDSSDHTDLSSHFSVINTPPEALRLIEIAHAEFDYQFNVPSAIHHHAARSRDRFLATIADDNDAEPSSLLELISRFLLFVIDHRALWIEASTNAHSDFIELLFNVIEADFLDGADVHSIAAKLSGDASQRQTVIRAYFTAMSHVGRSPNEHEAALFTSSTQQHGARIYAVFGGQGNTTNYFSELRSLHSTYTPFVEPLVEVADTVLRALLATASVTRLRQYSQGLDVLHWLQRPDSTPASEYLLSAPISFPLIGLVQFANYAVMCHVLGKSPGQIVESFIGMAGHSQGVVVAATIATATSWETFNIALHNALTLLFHIGAAAQEATPQVTVPSRVATDCVEAGEGFPTPMLNVSGCSRPQLQKYIESVNGFLEPHQRVAVGLINGRTNFVVTGPKLSLCALTANLRKVKAKPGLDQDKIAFSSRKPEFTTRFLPITAPFHSSHLAEAVKVASKDLETINIGPNDLKAAVYNSRTGEDLRTSKEANIVPQLIHMIHSEMDDWPESTVFPNATHVLDFGPGEMSGVGPLTHRNKEGTGMRVILAGTADGTSTEYGYRGDLFQRKAKAVKWGADWAKEHSPRLRKTRNGDLQIDNAFTRLLGLPPIMVAGMTPTTVWWDFVSAITNAGYHVELAGGGYHNQDQMITAIKNLQNFIPVGNGICVNVIYASPKQARWQVPLIQKLRVEGYPIDGLTFGAGVPSLDVANEYIATLHVRYMCFKPGSLNAINSVIAIARANPRFPVLCQWTGGRGGGHHSYEDFHDPILKAYGRIRRCPNVVLLAGSGFGGAEDTYPYLSGDWSVELGYPAMPFDGCLFGSRMMVAKEARTSRAAKEAIVAAPGVEDSLSWEQTYKKPTGGIITVKSEMGEPIHKIATRGVLLWRDMDDKVFSIPDKEKRREALLKMKPSIIRRLNADFQRVWFGRNSAGEVVDLEDMTYAEVLQRLVELLYIGHESRWIDPSYLTLTADFVRRMQSRLCDSLPTFEKDFGLKNPRLAVPDILHSCRKAEMQVITYDDARYFILLCKRPGQKPVTFVPVLDEDFEVWFKKDSLWQSEDLEAVADQDPQRTCILQGPVAARFSTIPDEPVGEILGKINQRHIDLILRDQYHGDDANVPIIGTEAIKTEKLRCPPHCTTKEEDGRTHYRIEEDVTAEELPATDLWLRLLAGKPGTWVNALLTSEDIFHGRKVQPNPIRRILAPVQGMHVEVTNTTDPEHIMIALFIYESEKSSTPKHELIIRYDKDEILVTFYTDETADKTTLPLTFKFVYRPEFVLHPIHEVMTGRNQRLRKFYYQLWFGNGSEKTKPTRSPGQLQRSPTRPFDMDIKNIAVRNKPQPKARPPISLNTAIMAKQSELETPIDLRAASFNAHDPTTTVFHGRDLKISSPSINDFAESIEQASRGIAARADKTMASLDFAIVVGWEAMMKAIFPKAINGEFLNLVHLSNKFTLINDAKPLSSFDLIESNAEILAIRNEPAGRVVEVGAIIERNEIPVLELVSEFLFRGTYSDFEVCFEKRNELKMIVDIDTPAKVAVLKSKNWLNFVEQNVDLLGLQLFFQLKSLNRFDNGTTWRSVETFGQVFYKPAVTKKYKLVATVHYEAGKCTTNPVMEYLKRNGRPSDITHTLENQQPLGEQDWLRITAPATNQAYARASGDFNPIHVSRPFAKYANLPGTITHGMYTSAAVRQLVEKAAGSNEEVRMRSYKASFIAMVLPGDELEVSVTHIAMKNGMRVLSFQAVKIKTDEKVLVGEAEVDQPLSTYIFTGQGSQKPEMGMDLAAISEGAKQVWDDADRYFNETYGMLKSTSQTLP